MKRICWLLIVNLLFTSVSAQQRWSLSLSNNVTSFPVLGYGELFYSNFHPGLDASWQKQIRGKDSNQLWWYASGGIYHHRFFQTAVRLHSGLEYARRIGSRFTLEGGLGVGYLHSFPAYQVFRQDADGNYERSARLGRMQFLGVLLLGAAWNLDTDPFGKSLFLQFRSHLQGPFAQSYVPVLPVNSLLVGVSFPLTPQQRKEP